MDILHQGVQVIHGADGIKQAYELTLKAKQLDIVCLSSEYTKVTGNYFEKVYGPKLYGSQTKTREILPDTKENRDDAKKKEGVKNQVKFLPISQKSESDWMMFDETIILVSYNESDPYAVVITDKDLIGNLKAQFNAVWKFL